MFSQLGTVTGTVRGPYGDRTGTVQSANRGIHKYKLAYLLVFLQFVAFAGPCWQLSVAEPCTSAHALLLAEFSW